MSIGQAMHMPKKARHQAKNKHLLPTLEASSRESSLARPRPQANVNGVGVDAQIPPSPRLSSQEQASQVEEPVQDCQQEEAEKVVQPQSEPVKGKRGRTRKRPLSVSAESPHVKVQIVPTPKQAEWQRKQKQQQSQEGKQSQGAVTRTIVPVRMNGYNAQDTNSTWIPTQASNRARTSQQTLQWNDVVSLDTGNHKFSQNEARPQNLQPDPYMHWAPKQDETFGALHLFSYNSGHTDTSQRSSTDENVFAPMEPKPGFNGIQGQTAAAKYAMKKAPTNGTARSSYPGRATGTMIKDGEVQKSEVQNKRSKNRTQKANTVLKEERQKDEAATLLTAEYSRFSRYATANEKVRKATIAIPNNGTEMSRKGKEKIDATETSVPYIVQSSVPQVLLKEMSALQSSPTVANRDCPSLQVSSVIGAQQNRPVPLELPQGKFPERITRWHDLGLKTFEYFDPHAKGWKHRVVRRSGKADNTMGFWYNLFLGQRAGLFPNGPVPEICLNLQRAWQAGNVEKMVWLAEKELVLRVAPGQVVSLRPQETSDAKQGVVEVARVQVERPAYGMVVLKDVDRKLVQATLWDFMLMEVIARGKAWRKRRRQRYFGEKWKEAAWAEKEVRARSRSRGAFVEDKDDIERWKSQLIVRHENSEAGGSFVIPEVPLSYQRDGMPKIATHWMGRDEINKVVFPDEIIRSKPKQVGVHEDGKPIMKMLFAKIRAYDDSQVVNHENEI